MRVLSVGRFVLECPTCFFTQHPGFEALVVFLGQDVEVDKVWVKKLSGHAGHVVDCHVRLLKIPAAAQVSANVANALLYRYGGVPVAGVGHTGPLKYGMSDVLRQVQASSLLLPPLEWRHAFEAHFEAHFEALGHKAIKQENLAFFASSLILTGWSVLFKGVSNLILENVSRKWIKYLSV